ncbi:MAG: Mycothiol acetyltransferase [Firmicutes bacterium ADurb.Bin506]|nr:MAG: Mycothiol acetyltransferase [Firmicutes bacterium ADurb.Bin506]
MKTGCEYRIRPFVDADHSWAAALLTEYWGSCVIATRGRLVDAMSLPALVAVDGGGDESVGLVTYEMRSDECEIVTLNSLRPREGIGRALLTAVMGRAREAGASRVWLITTNDNVPAIRFYQGAGFRIVAIHRDAVTAARRLKPEIPLFGEGGTPIKDEIELELKVGL